MEWNHIRDFPLFNGVPQEGILSPILLCVYLDGLTLRLPDAKTRCFVDQVSIGVMVDAEDIATIAPTSLAVCMTLRI